MEALLLGVWKNIEELEECISLPELEGILSASRDAEYRRNKFAAAMKGIDLDKGNAEDVKRKFDEVKRRVEARASGRSEKAIELDEFGIDVE